MPDVPASPGGLLGADFVVEGGRYKIAKIYDGESWNPELRAPLAAPGRRTCRWATSSSRSTAWTSSRPTTSIACSTAPPNRQTVLTVNTRPDTQGARQVTVVPVANEQGLRTRAWVEDNRRLRRQAIEWPARLRLHPQHRAGRLRELQPLLLRAAGQEGRGDRRALQRRRLGGRLHRRRARPRLRRLLQQRGRQPRAVHQPVGRHLGAEGDDRQRDGRLGRRPDAVDVQAAQDRPARGQAHVGRPRAHRGHARLHRRRDDDRAPGRVLHARGQVGGGERGRRRPISTSRTGRRTSSPAAIRNSSARWTRRCGC